LEGKIVSPTLTYIGHSAFALESDGHQILVDPFISGNPAAKHSPDDFNPGTILLTHAHDDHVGDTMEIAKRSGATVICIVELADYLEMQGVKTEAANHGGTISFDGGTVKLVPAWHSSSFSPEFLAPGVPSGLVVRFAGQTIYFAGDTCLFSDMKLIGEEDIDVAVLPIGDRFTMGINDAVRAVKFLDPATVIPCHYNTFNLIRQDARTFKKRVDSETDATVLILEPGESWDLD
jgi:L-ascorbate metabolism protein UlaG (beta-lactamase superfamily)